MQEDKLANTWCRKVTNAARFTVCGPNHEWIAYQPCCFVWTPDNTVESKTDIIRIYKDISDHVNKNKEQVCVNCVEQEKKQIKRSPRQMAHEIIPIDTPAGQFVQLEFVFDVRCNAACVMCGPHLSTMWQQELKIPVTSTEKTSKAHWYNVSCWIDWQPVRRVYFSGGEPLLTNTSDIVLHKIPDLSLVEIKYQTNGSVMPSESTLQHWKNAKKIILDISLDGTQDQYDYIRWPLQWKSVETNIHKLARWLDAHAKQCEININYTVNPMNLLYLKDMDDWFSEMKTVYGFFKNLGYQNCGHDIWGLDAASPELITQFLQTHGVNHQFSTWLNNFSNDKVKRQRLKQNLVELDQIRNLDWQKTFSKAIMIFEN